MSTRSTHSFKSQIRPPRSRLVICSRSSGCSLKSSTFWIMRFRSTHNFLVYLRIYGLLTCFWSSHGLLVYLRLFGVCTSFRSSHVFFGLFTSLWSTHVVLAYPRLSGLLTSFWSTQSICDLTHFSILGLLTLSNRRSVPHTQGWRSSPGLLGPA